VAGTGLSKIKWSRIFGSKSQSVKGKSSPVEKKSDQQQSQVKQKDGINTRRTDSADFNKSIHPTETKPFNGQNRSSEAFEQQVTSRGQRTEAERKAFEEKITVRKERTAADRKAYEDRINGKESDEASKNGEYEVKDSKFQYNGDWQHYQQPDSAYSSSTSLNRDFDSSKSETSSLYSHSNSSRDSGFVDEPVTPHGNSKSSSTLNDEPVMSSNAFGRDDHFDNFGGYSGQQKTSSTGESQQQSLYKHDNDSGVSVSSHYGESKPYRAQTPESIQFRAYSQKQSDRMYDYSSNHGTNIHSQRDAEPYSPYNQGTTQKQDEWGQPNYHYGNNTQVNHAEINPYHNIDSAHGKQSNYGFQQLHMQNSPYGKQQSWQTGHDPMYHSTTNKYSNNYHQGAFEPHTMQPIKENQVLTDFRPPPVKHTPTIKNNTEFHEPEGFAANHGIKSVNRPDASMMKMEADGSRPILVNGFKIDPKKPFDVKNGDNIEVDKTLYKVNHEQKLVPVSNDPATVKECFPNGINNITSRQGQVGDCAKMAPMHSFMTDPSAVLTKSLLDRIKRHPDGDGYIVTTGSGYKTHIPESMIHTKDDGVTKYMGRKQGDAQNASGDLGFQLLERAYHRQLKDDAIKNTSVFSSKRGELKRSDTLSEKVTSTDRTWSHKYSEDLVGKNSGYEAYTFDGTIKSSKMSSEKYLSQQKSSWSQDKLTFAERRKDPKQAAEMERVFQDMEKYPEKYRGTFWTKSAGSDRVQLPLSEKGKEGTFIYANHAYSAGNSEGKIITWVNGERRFHMTNPHNTDKNYKSVERDMSPEDFLNNVSLYDGLIKVS
jgi:hypothetical protein